MRRLTFFLFVLTLIAPGSLFAASLVDPLKALDEFTRPEAPIAIYDINIGDSAAEVFLEGGWTSGIAGYLGFDSLGNTGASIELPGFVQMPWYNSVDFVLSLWIDRHFFFEIKLGNGLKLDESALVSGLQMSSFSLGYASSTSPGLNRVQIANTGIGIPSFPYLGFGEAGEGIPGILSEWSGEKSHHWAMLRLVYRSSALQEFRGTAALITQSSSANSFIRGQFFQLPYDNLAAIRIWVESPSGTLAGDGHRYVEVGSRDLLFTDLARGRLGIKNSPAGRVLVQTQTQAFSAPIAVPALDRKSGIDPIDNVIFGGTGFVDRVLKPLKDRYLVGNGNSIQQDALGSNGLLVNIENTEAWIVHDPGRFSLFEDYAWYASPQNLEPDSVALDGDPALILAVGILGGFLHLGNDEKSSVSSRYPLLASTRSDLSTLYLTGASLSGSPRLNWYGQGLPGLGLVLDNDPVIDSILVTRNGRPEKGFSWDPEKKMLVFTTPIQTDEKIIVAYDIADQTSGPRSLQFAQANTWEPLAGMPMRAAIGLDWPLDGGTRQIQEQAGSFSMGHFVLGSDVHLAAPKTGLSLDSAISGRLDVPGTSGATILQDFSTGSLGIKPSSANLLPSNPVNWRQGNGLAIESRGSLIYRDFRSTTGDWLAWNSPDPSAHAYSEGQAMGPYQAAAASIDPFSGNLAVAEFQMTENQQWVSVELRLNDAQRAALQDTESLSWQLQAVGLTGGMHFWVEAGDLAEDIDGTGEIRSLGTGAYGLPFHDAGLDIDMIAAPSYMNSTGSILSKDANGNGWLDPERETFIATQDRLYGSGEAIASGDSTWKKFRWTLTEADRVRLQTARAIRLTARKDSAGSLVSGKLIWADLQVDQGHLRLNNLTSGMSANAKTGTDLSVHQELARDFPTAARPTDVPAYADLSWQSAAEAGLDLVQAVDPVSFSQFNVFRFFLRRESGSGPAGRMSLSLAGKAGSYDSAAFDLDLIPAEQWHEVTVDFQTARLEIRGSDGRVILDMACTLSGQPENYDAIILHFQAGTAAAGRFFLDSFQADQGVPQLSARYSIALDWTLAGNLLETAGFPWLGNLHMHQSAELGFAGDPVEHAGFSSGVGQAFTWSGSAGLIIAAIGIDSGVQMAMDAASTGGVFSYELTLPSGLASPIVAKDNFASSFGNNAPYLAKSSALSVNIGEWGKLSAKAGASKLDGLLHQEWKAELGLVSGQIFSLSSDFSLTQAAHQAFKDGEWDGLGLMDRIGLGYQWYLPSPAAASIKRSNALNNRIQLSLSPLTLDLSQSLSGQFSSSGAFSHNTELGFKTILGLSSGEAGWNAELSYLRSTKMMSDLDGSGLGGDIEQSWSDIAAMPSAWAVWPFFELGDPAPAFLAESLAWPKASTLPLVQLALVRPLENNPWIQLVPKRLDAAIARLINQSGGFYDDGLILFAKADWLALNLAGRNAAVPLFTFYGSDQVDAKVSTGFWLQEQTLQSWQLQIDLALSLFSLSPLGSNAGQAPLIRTQGRDGFLKLMTADQAVLKGAWYYRDGLQARNAGHVQLDWSWALDIPGLKLDFLPIQPDGPCYLQNIESLALDLASGTKDNATDASPLLQYYPFSSDGDFMVNAGTAVSFFHRSVFVLPDLGYISIILGYGLQQKSETNSLIQAIQCGIEARVVF